jgi:membrane-associated protease RseP (regulator of RpoE activity)
MSNRMNRDYEGELAEWIVGNFVKLAGYILFGVIVLTFRFPKVMLPLIALVIGVVVLTGYGPRLLSWNATQPVSRGAQTSVVAPTQAPKPSSDKNPSDAKPAEVVGVATADRLNIRAGPGTDQSVIGKLSKDEKVTVEGRNEAGDWLSISYNGGTGWVATKYIALQVPVADIPLAAASSNDTSSSAAPTTGMWIMEVEPGSEAANAGFRKGQLLVSLNGQDIQKAQTVNEIIAQNIGFAITAVLWENGREITATITPQDRLVGVTLCQLDRCPQGRYP